MVGARGLLVGHFSMAVAPAGVYMNSRSLAVVCQYGPSCSKLTMSLIELLKFQKCCMPIFLLKNVQKFLKFLQ